MGQGKRCFSDIKFEVKIHASVYYSQKQDKAINKEQKKTLYSAKWSKKKLVLKFVPVKQYPTQSLNQCWKFRIEEIAKIFWKKKRSFTHFWMLELRHALFLHVNAIQGFFKLLTLASHINCHNSRFIWLNIPFLYLLFPLFILSPINKHFSAAKVAKQ